MVSRKIQDWTSHHVDLTNMGKFYVGNVNESRDGTPCGHKKNNKILHKWCPKYKCCTMWSLPKYTLAKIPCA